MDISILRKKPCDRIRTVPLFGGGKETAEVLFCSSAEMKEIDEQAKGLMEKGHPKNDAYNMAYGRVALLGWAGLTEGGQPLPFTVENSDLLMLGSSEIRAAVVTAASSLKVDQEKN